RDLNLLGRASLFHLLGTAHTPPGKAALAAWLLAPADPGEIVRRQAAGIAPVFGLPGVLAWSPALLVGINLALSQAYAKRMSHTFNRISSREGEFQLYATALALLDGRRFASPRLVDIEKELAAGGLPAHRAHR